MGIKISDACWKEWAPVFLELHSEYSLPVQTKHHLNILLRLYDGTGVTFRFEYQRWKYSIDTLRSDSDDSITDITAVCLMRRDNANSTDLDEWIITRSCDIHGTVNADKVIPGTDMAWFRVSKNGQTDYCNCREECETYMTQGIPPGNWEITRLSIVNQANIQEIMALRRALNQSSQRDPMGWSFAEEEMEDAEEEIEDAEDFPDSMELGEDGDELVRDENDIDIEDEAVEAVRPENTRESVNLRIRRQLDDDRKEINKLVLALRGKTDEIRESTLKCDNLTEDLEIEKARLWDRDDKLAEQAKIIDKLKKEIENLKTSLGPAKAPRKRRAKKTERKDDDDEI